MLSLNLESALSHALASRMKGMRDQSNGSPAFMMDCKSESRALSSRLA